jgi:lipopolysaccharide export system permease protein
MFFLTKIIIREWFKALIGALIVLFLLVSIGDIINGFLQNYPARRIFIEYFLKLPDLASKMLPISSLLATLFSVNKLKSQNELMAILAASYSSKRIYQLIILCSLSVAAAQFLNLGYVIPAANKIKRQEFEKSRKSESKYLARSTIGTSGLIWYKTDDYFVSFKAFDSKHSTLKDVTIYFISDDNKLDSIYKSKSAKFLDDKKWELTNIGIIQDLDSNTFPTSTSAKNLIINLNEKPADFGQFESDITTLNIFELGNFIDRLRETDINSAEYEVMYYDKISLALICIIFSLFPAAGVFTPNRRSAGFGKSIVITLLFSIFFWGLHAGGLSLGNNGKLPAVLATLGIPGIFGVYIFSIFFKNRTL